MMLGKSIVLAALFVVGVACAAGIRESVPELVGKSFTYHELAGANPDGSEGIGRQEGVTRRDPSDVIRAGDTYFVYYSKVDHSKLPERDRRLRASGYSATIWYASSRDEGRTWVERGEALGVGAPGAFDSHAIFTPNILKADEKYYLFYTGVKPTPGRADGGFANNSTTDVTALGLAVSDSPGGPFRRVRETPILATSKPSNDPKTTPSRFDSFRVDDASLIVRDGKYWLYYKGRNIDDGQGGPGKTKMGVAIAETIEGPYVKQNGGDPILDSSHEVLVWPHREGVAAYASMSRALEYATDGLDFTSDPLGATALPKPIAPGAYRPDLTEPVEYGRGIQWGIAMRDPGGPYPYLIRYEIDLRVSAQSGS